MLTGGNGAGLEQLRVRPWLELYPCLGNHSLVIRAGKGHWDCYVSLLLLTNLGMLLLFHALGCRAAEQSFPGRQGRSLNLPSALAIA